MGNDHLKMETIFLFIFICIVISRQLFHLILRTSAKKILHSQSGNSILMVLAFIAASSIIFYPMLSKIKDIYAQQNKTNTMLQERMALNSMVDFMIYAFKQRMCITPTLTNTSPCDFNQPYDTELLMLTPDSVAFLKQAKAAGMNVVIPPSIDQFVITGELSNLSLGPLGYMAKSMTASPAKKYKITASRIVSASLPQTANQVYISINVQFGDSSGNFPVSINNVAMSMTSLLTIYPREIGTFALMIAKDLHMDTAYSAPPTQDCSQATSGGCPNGDTIFHMFSGGASAVGGPGLIFESPVFVNGDVYLPTGDHQGKTGPYAAVTFADRLYVGNGKIYQGAGKVYTPSQPGIQSDSQWSNNVLFGGFQKGVQIDGYQDAGLQVFAGVVPAFTNAALTALVTQCIGLTNANEDATLTENTVLTSSPAPGGPTNTANYHIGFSQLDEFSAQDVANGPAFTQSNPLSLSGNASKVIVNTDNTSAIVNMSLSIPFNGANAPLTASNIPLSIGSSVTIQLDETAYFNAQLATITNYVNQNLYDHGSNPGQISNYNSIASQINSIATLLNATQVNVATLTNDNTTKLPDLVSQLNTANLPGQLSTLSSLLTAMSPQPPNASVLASTLSGLTSNVNTLTTNVGTLDTNYKKVTNSANGALQQLVATPPSIVISLNSVSIAGNAEPNQANLSITFNNPQLMIDLSTGTKDNSTNVIGVTGLVGHTGPDSGPSTIATNTNPIKINLIGFDNSFAGGLNILPASTSASGTPPPSLQLGGMINNCSTLQSNSKIAYGDCRIQNMSGSIAITTSNGNVNFQNLINKSTGNSPALDTTDVAGLGVQCGKASGAVTGAAFGSASWTNTDFSPQTIHSWNYAVCPTCAPLTPAQVAASSLTPVIDSLVFDGTNSNGAVKNNVTFQVGSIATTCKVKSSATLVTGFLTCNEFIIESRTKPLRIIGSVVAKSVYIDPSAFTAGITWSSIYQTQATYELQSAGVLAARFPQATPPACASVQLSSPIWNPAPAAGDMANLYGCNVLSLRAQSNPIQWTSVDPDCGVLDVTGAGACTATSTSCQSNTTCKHHMTNFFVVEQSRAGGP
jgi:hypothetical protein